MFERHDSIAPVARSVPATGTSAQPAGFVDATHGERSEARRIWAMLGASLLVHLVFVGTMGARAVLELVTPSAQASTAIHLAATEEEILVHDADDPAPETAPPTLPEPEPAPEPEPEPEPAEREPEPEPPHALTPQLPEPPQHDDAAPQPDHDDEPYPDDAPAEASKILTDGESDDSDGFVNGNGDGSGHGHVSVNGKGNGRAATTSTRPPVTSPAAPARSAYRIGEVDQPPSVLSASQPVYPRSALRRRSEGAVRVRMLIDARGHVTNATVVTATGHASFKNAALNAARTWRFTPGKVHGRAVSVWATRTIHFQLPRR